MHRSAQAVRTLCALPQAQGRFSPLSRPFRRANCSTGTSVDTPAARPPKLAVLARDLRRGRLLSARRRRLTSWPGPPACRIASCTYSTYRLRADAACFACLMLHAAARLPLLRYLFIFYACPPNQTLCPSPEPPASSLSALPLGLPLISTALSYPRDTRCMHTSAPAHDHQRQGQADCIGGCLLCA